MRQSYSLVPTVIDADRYARSHSSNPKQYREILMRQRHVVIERRLADAAAVLAEVWMFEWNQAGSPNTCGGRGFLPIEASFARPSAGIPSQ